MWYSTRYLIQLGVEQSKRMQMGMFFRAVMWDLDSKWWLANVEPCFSVVCHSRNVAKCRMG